MKTFSRMWFPASLLLPTGSTNILPVQVKYESDNITETKNENRSWNPDFQYRTKKAKKGNDNLKSVVQSSGKMKSENRSFNSIFNGAGKQKTKTESRIPFSDGVGKRKTKLEVRIPFSQVVGKRLALRYTHYTGLTRLYDVSQPPGRLQGTLKQCLRY